MKADAAAVFHDIKPLPEFHLLPLWPVMLLIVAALFLCWWWFRRPAKATGPTAPAVFPDRRALDEIERLATLRAAGRIGAREFAAALSLTLRQYFESVLHFPATEQTPREIGALLETVLKRSLPVVPKDKREELATQMLRVLRLCERATFADSAETFYPVAGSEFERALAAAKEGVTTLRLWLMKEEERTASVVREGAHAS